MDGLSYHMTAFIRKGTFLVESTASKGYYEKTDLNIKKQHRYMNKKIKRHFKKCFI